MLIFLFFYYILSIEIKLFNYHNLVILRICNDNPFDLQWTHNDYYEQACNGCYDISINQIGSLYKNKTLKVTEKAINTENKEVTNIFYISL